ncbi:Glutaredoxin [Duganella sp. CF458]|uniref:glutaredoxin family protein n=1 Tax=Duganella sp. CF458 TaxID=1884368 RepID=UPI0008F1B16A|nr:glutaredoxin domain-containing protein [Duganella sp. CF458]SFG97611.1 Glutaredoxin [Duganella sp. CF458]
MSKTVICPKCSHVRPPDATNPEWQCPACGVCYTKANEPSPSAASRYASAPVQVKQGWDWGPLVKIALVVVVGWAVSKYFTQMRGPDAAGNTMMETVEERLQSAAAGAKRTDIMLYSAPWCGYCKEAKATFAANDIPYTDCNVEGDLFCKDQFDRLHGTGFPLFVVRGKRLQEGLNYNALISALNEDKPR